MENAVDALKMAAAILIFIIAIASSFSLFGTAKQTADSIITMRDKQAYLESADAKGYLYTTPSSITENGTEFTDKGDRIVNIDDIVSAIYRYSKEKYGVSIIDLNGTKGTVIARYDTNTETYISNYNNLASKMDEKTGAPFFEAYRDKIKQNLITDYCSNIQFYSSEDKIENLYKIDYEDNPETKYGAPWLIDEVEIVDRINCDLRGTDYKYQGQIRKIDTSLLDSLKGKKIVEVTNEIDESKYLEDTDETGKKIETNLLQQYNMPTIEVVYVILD